MHVCLIRQNPTYHARFLEILFISPNPNEARPDSFRIRICTLYLEFNLESRRRYLVRKLSPIINHLIAMVWPPLKARALLWPVFFFVICTKPAIFSISCMLPSRAESLIGYLGIQSCQLLKARLIDFLSFRLLKALPAFVECNNIGDFISDKAMIRNLQPLCSKYSKWAQFTDA